MAPSELEQRAERAVRRGDLLAALELYETLLAEQPDDERVRTRIESVRALLQPSELLDRRRSEPEEVEEKPRSKSRSPRTPWRCSRRCSIASAQGGERALDPPRSRRYSAIVVAPSLRAPAKSSAVTAA